MRIFRITDHFGTLLFGDLIKVSPVLRTAYVIPIYLFYIRMMFHIGIRELITVTNRPTTGKKSNTPPYMTYIRIGTPRST